MKKIVISLSDIDAFASDMGKRNIGEGTIKGYYLVLRRFYLYLPEDKAVTTERFERFLERQQEKRSYKINSLNVAISAFNRFMSFLDHPEFVIEHRKKEPANTPELSNNDYIRLLSFAKQNKKRKEYLLIKLFANTSIRVTDMACITVGAVEEGVLRPESRGKIELSGVLRKDLKAYIDDNDINSGFLFRGGNGEAIGRSRVETMITGIAENAGFEKGLVNPRSLQKLRTKRMELLRKQQEAIVSMMFEKMMETEEHSVAWD